MRRTFRNSDCLSGWFDVALVNFSSSCFAVDEYGVIIENVYDDAFFSCVASCGFYANSSDFNHFCNLVSPVSFMRVRARCGVLVHIACRGRRHMVVLVFFVFWACFVVFAGGCLAHRVR